MLSPLSVYTARPWELAATFSTFVIALGFVMFETFTPLAISSVNVFATATETSAAVATPTSAVTMISAKRRGLAPTRGSWNI